MNLRQLRFAEQIPPTPVEDARRLRSLPTSWERAVPESAIDSLLKRAEALARARRASGDARAAAGLRRAAAMLRRADALHEQAGRLETLAQLCLALAALRDDLVLAGADGDGSVDESIGWLQAGALPTAELSSAHGSAFRETAALRNRAFRQLEAAIAEHMRAQLKRDRRCW